MFCINCGKEVVGQFCHHCGTKVPVEMLGEEQKVAPQQAYEVPQVQPVAQAYEAPQVQPVAQAYEAPQVQAVAQTYEAPQMSATAQASAVPQKASKLLLVAAILVGVGALIWAISYIAGTMGQIFVYTDPRRYMSYFNAQAICRFLGMFVFVAATIMLFIKAKSIKAGMMSAVGLVLMCVIPILSWISSTLIARYTPYFLEGSVNWLRVINSAIFIFQVAAIALMLIGPFVRMKGAKKALPIASAAVGGLWVILYFSDTLFMRLGFTYMIPAVLNGVFGGLTYILTHVSLALSLFGNKEA